MIDKADLVSNSDAGETFMKRSGILEFCRNDNPPGKIQVTPFSVFEHCYKALGIVKRAIELRFDHEFTFPVQEAQLVVFLIGRSAGCATFAEESRLGEKMVVDYDSALEINVPPSAIFFYSGQSVTESIGAVKLRFYFHRSTFVDKSPMTACEERV